MEVMMKGGTNGELNERPVQVRTVCVADQVDERMSQCDHLRCVQSFGVS